MLEFIKRNDTPGRSCVHPLCAAVFVTCVLLTCIVLATAAHAEAAPHHGLIPLASADATCAWHLSNPERWQQTLSLIDYSRAIPKVLQITATPSVFQYSELRLKKPLLIARNAEEFNGFLSLDLFSDPAEAMLAVCVRVQDSSGEIFQYHQPISTRLRSGQWSTLSIPVGTPYKFRSNWSGNQDGVIDYPVSFIAITIDYMRGFIGQTRMLLDQFTWTAAKENDEPEQAAAP
jgi:hypothetical protein